MAPYYCCLGVFSDDICGDGDFLFCSAGVGEEDAEYSAWAPWKEVKRCCELISSALLC